MSILEDPIVDSRIDDAVQIALDSIRTSQDTYDKSRPHHVWTMIKSATSIFKSICNDAISWNRKSVIHFELDKMTGTWSDQISRRVILDKYGEVDIHFINVQPNHINECGAIDVGFTKTPYTKLNWSSHTDTIMGLDLWVDTNTRHNPYLTVNDIGTLTTLTINCWKVYQRERQSLITTNVVTVDIDGSLDLPP